MDIADRYYEILGVKPGVSPEIVRRAYQELLFQLDPSSYAGDSSLKGDAAKRREEIEDAYKKIIQSFADAEAAANKEEILPQGQHASDLRATSSADQTQTDRSWDTDTRNLSTLLLLFGIPVVFAAIIFLVAAHARGKTSDNYFEAVRSAVSAYEIGRSMDLSSEPIGKLGHRFLHAYFDCRHNSVCVTLKNDKYTIRKLSGPDENGTENIRSLFCPDKVLIGLMRKYNILFDVGVLDADYNRVKSTMGVEVCN